MNRFTLHSPLRYAKGVVHSRVVDGDGRLFHLKAFAHHPTLDFSDANSRGEMELFIISYLSQYTSISAIDKFVNLPIFISLSETWTSLAPLVRTRPNKLDSLFKYCNFVVLVSPLIQSPVEWDRLTQRELVEASFQVVASVQALSKLGVTHNDLHLNNILVERQPCTFAGRVMSVRINIIDFDRATTDIIANPHAAFPSMSVPDPSGKRDMLRFACALYYVLATRALPILDSIITKDFSGRFMRNKIITHTTHHCFFMYKNKSLLGSSELLDRAVHTLPHIRRSLMRIINECV